MGAGANTVGGMRLSDESLGRFKEIYKRQYGIELPVDDAREMAGNLINLYRLILEPLPEDPTTPALKQN